MANLTSFVLKSMKFDQRLLCTSVSGLHSEAFDTFFMPRGSHPADKGTADRASDGGQRARLLSGSLHALVDCELH